MQEPLGPVLVKLKATSLREWCDHTVQAIVIVLGIGILFLVSVDATVNNWAVNDFIGNGHMFVAPLGRVDNARLIQRSTRIRYQEDKYLVCMTLSLAINGDVRVLSMEA